ncbi:unnamed protein product [Amaranthus hypochondriacus]
MTCRSTMSKFYLFAVSPSLSHSPLSPFFFIKIIFLSFFQGSINSTPFPFIIFSILPFYLSNLIHTTHYTFTVNFFVSLNLPHFQLFFPNGSHRWIILAAFYGLDW